MRVSVDMRIDCIRLQERTDYLFTFRSMASVERLGVDVIINDIDNNPACTHGEMKTIENLGVGVPLLDIFK